MTRIAFIKMCGILGISLPLQAMLMSCSKEHVSTTSFPTKVLIIGAGAGGLSAGDIYSNNKELILIFWKHHQCTVVE